MKKNIFKRMIVSILALSLVFSFSGPISAASHAPNGSDVLPDSFTWDSFSVRQDLVSGDDNDCSGWEIDLVKAMDEALKGEFGKFYTNIKKYTPKTIENARADAIEKAAAALAAGQITQAQYDEMDLKTGWDKDNGIMAWQSGTYGWVNPLQNTAHDADLWCASTGWDGEYAAQTHGGKKVLVADNPWGLKFNMTKIPVEYNRYYTMEFDISSELEDPDTHERMDKQVWLKAYDYQSNGDPAAAFEEVKINGKSEAKDGKFVIPKTPSGDPDVVTHVSATFKIPETKDEWSGGHDKGSFTHMGIMFACGAFLKTRPEEVNYKGTLKVRNMKIIAGTQYAVKYYDGSAVKALRYVNEYEQAKNIALKKKGYTQTGYVDMATGKKFSFGTLIEKDTNLRVTWTKTPKPSKASFKLKSKKKKKVTVTFKKNKNARGYEIKYSHSKKFKKKAKYKTKTKTTNSTSKYTIKGLKSSEVAYFKARAFNKDSCGNKIYGKWSKRKSVYVK